jgi:NADH:ubiquinone oxidoreductase subunit D
MDFNVPVAGHGDCFDRYLVRAEHSDCTAAKQSLSMHWLMSLAGSALVHTSFG